MKTFSDLEFKTHPNASGSMFGTFGKQARLDFPNGYGVSVVIGGSGTYGDAEHPYEIAVMEDGLLCYDTPITNDVLGHQTKEDVTSIMERVQAL